jgi:glutathione S-transferase
MIIFGSSVSPYVRKVLVICAEKGVEVENQVFGPGSPPSEAFLAASPFRKIPALQDGDYTLADSTAIAHYLEAKHPEPALIPKEPKLLGKVVWFDEFSDTIGFGAGGKIFWNRVIGPLVRLPFDPEIADKAEREEMPPCLDYLEGVAGDGWLVGDRFTLADISVGSFLVNYDFSGCVIDAARYPKLSAYLSRVHDRPSFKSLIAKDRAFLTKVGAIKAA